MSYPTATIARVIGEQFGFLTADDVHELSENPATRHLNVLVRAHTGRLVVPMHRANAVAEAQGDMLRDVSLTADEHRRLREHG